MALRLCGLEADPFCPSYHYNSLFCFGLMGIKWLPVLPYILVLQYLHRIKNPTEKVFSLLPLLPYVENSLYICYVNLHASHNMKSGCSAKTVIIRATCSWEWRSWKRCLALSSQDLQKGFGPSTEKILFTYLSSSFLQSLASPFPKDQVRSWAWALKSLLLFYSNPDWRFGKACVPVYLSLSFCLFSPMWASFCYPSSCCTGSLCVAVIEIPGKKIR